MDNWLNQLAMQKQRAIREKAAQVARLEQERKVNDEVTKSAKIALLQAVSNIVRHTQIEKHLVELATTIVAGYPDYDDAAVHRRLTNEVTRPWTGFLWKARGSQPEERVDFLPINLDIDFWYDSCGIEWRLVFKGDEKNGVGIIASVSAKDVRINRVPLLPISVESVQKALVTAFQKPVEWREPSDDTFDMSSFQTE